MGKRKERVKCPLCGTEMRHRPGDLENNPTARGYLVCPENQHDKHGNLMPGACPLAATACNF